MSSSSGVFSIDINKQPWERRDLPEMDASFFVKPLIVDGETGMRVTKICYKAGFTNTSHWHNCAHTPLCGDVPVDMTEEEIQICPRLLARRLLRATTSCGQGAEQRSQMSTKWRTRHDSNVCPSPSEGVNYKTNLYQGIAHGADECLLYSAIGTRLE